MNWNADQKLLTLSEIKVLDAGVWKAEVFRNTSFLTFQEVLDLVADKTRLNVHVKAYEHDRSEIIRQVVHKLERKDLLGSTFLASDEASIRLARQTQPELAICNLSTNPKETYIQRCLEIGCRILQPGNAQVDHEFVAEAHRHGMEVNPFYADDEQEMRRMIDCGVDGILPTSQTDC